MPASKPPKTPAAHDFILPTEALTEAIAQEWQVQGKKINLASMPLTQLAYTAIDIVAPDKIKIIVDVAAYAGAELLCHRATEPIALIEKQQREWQPFLDWAAKRFGVKLKVQAGIMPFAQPPEALQALRTYIEGLDNFRLAGLQQAVSVSGSLVLGLALIEGHSDAAQVFDAAELDATYQIDKWGDDPAVITRRAGIRRDLDVLRIVVQISCV